VKLNTNSLNIETDVVDVEGVWKPLINLELSPLKDKVGFGSYNALLVELTNPYNYYVPTEVLISRSEGIKMYDDFNRYVLMEPREKKKEYWIIRVEDSLQENYIYNFTIKAYTVRNASDKINIISSDDHKAYSLGEIRDLIENKAEEEKKTYSQNLEIDCSGDDHYYVNREVEVMCVVTNTGNVILNGLDVCMASSCETVDLFIGQKKFINLKRVFSEQGPQDITITAKNDDVTKTTNVMFDIWDRPEISLDNITYPKKVKLNEEFKVEFKLARMTESIPKNVNINLVTDAFEKEWHLDELTENRKYILNVDDYTLSQESNKFTIFLTYEDALGRKFSEKEEFSIDLTEISLTQRGILILNRINVDVKNDILIIAIAIFVAGIVVGLIFKTTGRKENY